MKKKAGKRILRKAGEYAVKADYYGRLCDSALMHACIAEAEMYKKLWEEYTRQFNELARRFDVIEAAFGVFDEE